LSASYLDDALGDLLRAVRAIAQGAPSACASWAEEPGEFRWLFDRTAGRLRIRILWFDELWSDAPEGQGELRFDATCEAAQAVRAGAGAARRVIDRYGEVGYRARWVEHPFPTDERTALEALL
jgi:hypothetical protein